MSGNTSVSNQTDTLLNLTAGFDFRGENTRIDADIGYTNRNITGTQGGTFLGAGLQLPPAPNAQNNYYPRGCSSSSPKPTACCASSTTSP